MIKKRNVFDGVWNESSHGEKFQREHMALTDMREGHALGCGAFRVAPGKRAFPKHAHLGNDEAVFIIAGSGTLVVGNDETTVAAGDFAMLPRGSDLAHVLINSGNEDLLYLCMSTMNAPEVVHYPDSGKLGVMEDSRSWQGDNSISGFYRTQKAGYYDGED